MIVRWPATPAMVIASPWVKDEAQVGQERGVLLPVCIDAVAPPLGFRQLQTVDLTGWRPAAPGAAFEKLVFPDEHSFSLDR